MMRICVRNGLAVAVLVGLLAACESPVAYRPEVEQFQNATAEAAAFMEARRKNVSDLRKDLRKEILLERQPFVMISEGCGHALREFNTQVGSGAPTSLKDAEIDDCKLTLPEDSEIEDLFNSRIAMTNSAAFASAVATYAAALNKVATSGDQAGFVNAVDELGNATTSLVTSAAKAAGGSPPSIADLSPIASVVGKAVFYYLENRRAEALKDAANSAHSSIEKGAAAVVRVLYSERFESIRAANDNLFVRVDVVNDATTSAYPGAADKAISAHLELQTLLGGDPGAPFRKLPQAHQKLIDAFEDRGRHLEGAIAAAKDLFEAARDARVALSNN